MVKKKDILLLKHLIVEERADEVRNIFAKLHPADIAEILLEVKDINKNLFWNLMDYKKAVQVFEEFEPSDRAVLLQEMTENEALRILEDMSTDELIEMLRELPNKEVDKLISKLPKSYYEELKSLLRLADDTAGGLMTTDYVYLFPDATINEAIEDVRKFGQEAETIYYLYVVDNSKKLIGVLSLRELLSAPRHCTVGEIMHKNVISVDVSCDQEEAAKVIYKYSLLAVPVVDKNHRMLGIITVDDALEIIEEEDTEDIHRLAGITPEQEVILTSSIWGASKQRILWLVICLAGDFVSGLVIDGYSAILQSVVAIAFFIPVLMATGGNVGTQSLALSVRGIATGELDRQNILKFLIEETVAGLIVGAICGLILTGVAYFWQTDLRLGLAVGLSMTVALTVSAFIGVLIPIIFSLLKIDPAIASGPFITTIVDTLSLLIYFTFSVYLMGFFHIQALIN